MFLKSVVPSLLYPLLVVFLFSGSCLGADGTLKWFFTADSSEDPSNPGNLCEMNTSPAIGPDGTIYMATNDMVSQEVKNYLYAINKDGSLKWRRPVVEGDTPVISRDGTIYVASPKGEKLYAISPDNTVKWVFDFTYFNYTRDSYDIGIPSIGPDGTIYIINNIHYCRAYCEYQYIIEWDNKYYIHAINPDGTEKWKNELDDRAKRLIAVDKNTIYVPALNEFYAITDYGTKKWIIESAHFDSPVIGNDGSIYVLGGKNVFDVNGNYLEYQKGLFKINKSTGNNSLIHEIPYSYYFTYPPVLGDNDTIYFRTRYRNYEPVYVSELTSLSSNGAHNWTITLNDNVRNWSSGLASPALSRDGVIYTVAVDGYLYAINTDGTERWKFDTGNIALGSSPAIGSDGTVYLGSNINRLYAVNSESGPLASTQWPMLLKDLSHSGSTCTYDPDDDGVCGASDNCQLTPNAAQIDSDRDNIGNACDNCPYIYNQKQSDVDRDYIGDACDSGDYDGDGISDQDEFACNSDPADPDSICSEGMPWLLLLQK